MTAWQPNTELFARIYRDLNRRQYVHPDPLEFLYNYQDPADREVVAMVASSLAFGKVGQILKAVQAVLDELGPSPANFLKTIVAQPNCESLKNDHFKKFKKFLKLKKFKYRFVKGENILAMLMGLGRVITRHGSLQGCFAAHCVDDDKDQTVLPAAKAFITELNTAADNGCGYLLASPTAGSACKRLMLMLRWLVRKDRVDPGGWNCISPAKLIIPLDTHMHRLGLALGMTRRKTADMKTALEITACFRQILPDDPVKYDFALTRLGIRDDMNFSDFFIFNPPQ